MAQQAFDLWFEFEITNEWSDDPEDDFFNMLVTLEDGSKYTLGVWTFKFVDRARRHAAEEGKQLDGRYLLAPDLLVTHLDRDYLEMVVADLIAHGGLRDEWRCD